ELREPFHHWVRTIGIPVREGALGEPLDSLLVAPSGPDAAPLDEGTVRHAKDLWLDIALDLSDVLRAAAKSTTARIENALNNARGEAWMAERKRFGDRLKEVERAIRETTIAKLERERDRVLAETRQTALFPEQSREVEEKLRNVEDELHRRRHHYEELLA